MQRGGTRGSLEGGRAACPFGETPTRTRALPTQARSPRHLPGALRLVPAALVAQRPDRPVSHCGTVHHTLYLETFYKKKTKRVLALPRSQDIASNKPQSVKGLCH